MFKSNYRRIILILLMAHSHILLHSADIDTVPANLTKVDFSLNGRKHLVLNLFDLASPSKPLQTFFPWMESLEGLELQLPSEDIRWRNPEELQDIWQNAVLEMKDGTWFFRWKNVKLHQPGKIALWGETMVLEKLIVWSGIERDEAYETRMKAAMIMRGVPLEWKKVEHLHLWLAEASNAELPHLVFFNQFDAYSLRKDVSGTQVVNALELQFPSISPEDSETSSQIIKEQLFQPENIVPFLVNEGKPGTDNQAQLSLERLVELLEFGKHIIAESERPEPLLPGTESKKVLLYQYTAVPSRLEQSPKINKRLSRLLIEDSVSLFGYEGATDTLPVLTMDPRPRRFFDSYERMGRQALTGRIPVALAAVLIRNYTNNHRAGK